MPVSFNHNFHFTISLSPAMELLVMSAFTPPIADLSAKLDTLIAAFEDLKAQLADAATPEDLAAIQAQIAKVNAVLNPPAPETPAA